MIDLQSEVSNSNENRKMLIPASSYLGTSLVAQLEKKSACNAGDFCSIPGS